VSAKYLLEISVQTLEGAMAAERGGADRIELCENLSIGGVTPSTELLRATRARLHIPIFSMVRPRGGDFMYSAAEFAEMQRTIVAAKECGADGVVLGILTKDQKVDLEQTRGLVEIAKPLPVTFHRGFDEAADLRQALEDVIRSGAQRILTSGGPKSALEGSVVLAELIEAAREQIVIVPGAGIKVENIGLIAQRTKAHEFHSGLSSSLPYGSREHKKFEEEVRKLAEQLARISPARSISD